MRVSLHPAPPALALVAAAALLVGAPLAAQEPPDPGPLVTDRPDFTESASTVSPGLLQLEAGYTFSRSGSDRQHDVGETLLRIGVRERIELRLGVPTFTVLNGDPEDVDGFGDASLGLKVALSGGDDGGAPETALLVATSVPTGEDGLGASGLRPGATLALGWSLPKELGLGVNLGYERFESEGRDLGRAKGSVALGVPLSPTVGAFLEGFLLVPEGSRPERPFADTGFTVLLSPDLQLDVRAGVGLDRPRPSWFVGTGLSVRW